LTFQIRWTLLMLPDLELGREGYIFHFFLLTSCHFFRLGIGLAKLG